MAVAPKTITYNDYVFVKFDTDILNRNNKGGKFHQTQCYARPAKVWFFQKGVAVNN